MEQGIVSFKEPVTIVGGAYVSKEVIQRSHSLSSKFIGVDGGGNTLLDGGYLPELILGDMDSFDPKAGVIPKALPIHQIPDQESTDFEKCLRAVHAPIYIGLGFIGERLDHSLAALSVLARYREKKCILIGEDDVVFLVPPHFQLDTEVGTRVSLFPLGDTRLASNGLVWPTHELNFSPLGQIGTSNKSTGPIELRPESSKMLCFLPVDYAGAVLAALERTVAWPPVSAD